MTTLTRFRLVVAALALTATAMQAQAPAVPSFNPADVDTTCKPCENFYKFATDGWKNRTPIPAAFASWSSFDELTLRNLEVVRGIAESAARDAATTSDRERAKLGNFYGTCMDSVAVESRGIEPLRDYLDRIDRIATRADLHREIGRLASLGLTPFSRRSPRRTPGTAAESSSTPVRVDSACLTRTITPRPIPRRSPSVTRIAPMLPPCCA
jgi:hypothetical protein